MPSAALIKSSSSPEVGGGVGCLISPRAASVHTYSPIGIPPPHKLQHFQMLLWISEQRHQSQFLLIFIERSGSRGHLYIREPAVIKRSYVDRVGFEFSISPSVTLDAFNPPPARHSSACSAAENEPAHLHV